MKIIKFYKVNHYGRTIKRLADKKEARIFQKLTNRRTIDFEDVYYISLLAGEEVKLEETIEPDF